MLKFLVTVVFVGMAMIGSLPTTAWATPVQASVEWLGADTSTAQFRQADRPQPLEFPQDFGSHPDYQTEWWYYTGNLETETGRPFGFQFTIFRRALSPEKIPSTRHASDWRSRQVYFSHFTVSDIEGGDFYPEERFSRGSAQLAGAQAEPYRVWLQDWDISETPDHQIALHAQTKDVGLNLELKQTLPPILQGDRGYSIKGSEPGNASYYYSQVQQQAQGIVRVNDQTFPVKGLSWTDHEYSTSALSPGTEGWDWFSLQFDNHTALMIYILRQADGSTLPLSRGSFTDTDGVVTALAPDDWNIEVLDHWKSPINGAQYPSQWRIQIPKLDLTLQGKPMMANQELNLSTTYWEGAVQFSGAFHDQPVGAKGYVELTGYKEKLTTLS